VFENRALRRIFGPKRDEVAVRRIKLHNEELRDLCSSRSIIRMIKEKDDWMFWTLLAWHRIGRSGELL
jgi:hypothetical protein